MYPLYNCERCQHYADDAEFHFKHAAETQAHLSFLVACSWMSTVITFLAFLLLFVTRSLVAQADLDILCCLNSQMQELCLLELFHHQTYLIPQPVPRSQVSPAH